MSSYTSTVYSGFKLPSSPITNFAKNGVLTRTWSNVSRFNGNGKIFGRDIKFYNLKPKTKYSIVLTFSSSSITNNDVVYYNITPYCVIANFISANVDIFDKNLGENRRVNTINNLTSMGANKLSSYNPGTNFLISSSSGTLFVEPISIPNLVAHGTDFNGILNRSDIDNLTTSYVDLNVPNASVQDYSLKITAIETSRLVEIANSNNKLVTTTSSGSNNVTTTNNNQNDITVVSSPSTTVTGSSENNVSIPLSSTSSGTTTQDLSSAYIQTFFLDSNYVNGSSTIDLTDISVYFKSKPDRKNNIAGLEDPNVILSVIEVDYNKPKVSTQITNSLIVKEYSDVIDSSDASAETVFRFSDPLRLKTGRKYAFTLTFGSPEYEVWSCVSGDRTLGTNISSPGPTSDHQGELYTKTNSTATINDNNFNDYFVKKDNADLKFDLHIAEYDVSNNIIVEMTNSDDEFLIVDTITGDMLAGEPVYVPTANATGTISVTAGEETLTGVSTTFTSLNEDEIIVLIDSSNTSIVDFVRVGTVISDTEILLDSPAGYTISGNFQRTVTASVGNFFPETNKLILTNSTANATNYIESNTEIIGLYSGFTTTVQELEPFPVSVFSTSIDMEVPTAYTANGYYNFAYASGNTYVVSTANNKLNFFEPNHVRNYQAVILSRSTEVVELAGAKSATMVFEFEHTNKNAVSFVNESPKIDIDGIELVTTRWKTVPAPQPDPVAPETTLEAVNSLVFGNSATQHISTKLVMERDVSAEDIRVIYNAYRPPGTELKCYAKILNSEDPELFEDKVWSLLEIKRGQNEFSAANNSNDYREYEFGFQFFPQKIRTLVGTVDTETQVSNNTVIGSGTEFANTSTGVEAGDVIRIYNPLFPNENYGVFSIESVNSDTEIVLTEAVSNVNIIGTGLKIDKVASPRSAFSNKENLNIVRYFGSNGESYDGYSVVAIKTVLHSDSPNLVPAVNDYRVISVSS